MVSLLCGIDESAPARHAAYVAAHYARLAGADLTLMHVVAGTARRAADSRAIRERARSARLALDELVNDSADALGARPHLRVGIGTPADQLLVAADEDIDDTLIVIGQPRRGRVADLLLGDTHRRLVRHARHPVMIVPAGARPPNGADVVVGCDVASDRHPAAITAAHVARHLDAGLTVVNVQSGPTGWQIHRGRRDLMGALRRMGVEDDRVRFVEHAGDVDADVVVVDADRRSAWRRFARASAASEFTGAAARPIIVAPPSAEALAWASRPAAHGWTRPRRIA